MFDVQAWYVRDVIMGKISLSPDTEIQQDIDKWVARHDELLNPIEQIDFQSDYLRDLFPSIVDCSKIDINLVAQHFKEWEHHKVENILT